MISSASALAVFFGGLLAVVVQAWTPTFLPHRLLLHTFVPVSSNTVLHMALDKQMEGRLDGIRRSYLALTERLGDPDVIADANLLRKVMADRAQSEEVVSTYDEVCVCVEQLFIRPCVVF